MARSRGSADRRVEPQPATGSTVRAVLVTLAVRCLSFVVLPRRRHSACSTTPRRRDASPTSAASSPRASRRSGPVDANGHLLALGTPIAVLRIPSLGMREVVGEGTTGSVLDIGPGPSPLDRVSRRRGHERGARTIRGVRRSVRRDRRAEARHQDRRHHGQRHRHTARRRRPPAGPAHPHTEAGVGPPHAGDRDRPRVLARRRAVRWTPTPRKPLQSEAPML